MCISEMKSWRQHGHYTSEYFSYRDFEVLDVILTDTKCDSILLSIFSVSFSLRCRIALPCVYILPLPQSRPGTEWTANRRLQTCSNSPTCKSRQRPAVLSLAASPSLSYFSHLLTPLTSLLAFIKSPHACKSFMPYYFLNQITHFRFFTSYYWW